MHDLDRIALTRLHLLRARPGSASPQVAAAVVAELAHVGVRVTDPQAVTDAFARDLPGIIAQVRQLRGEHGTYAPLFRGFPEQLPRFDDAELRFALGVSRLVGHLVAAGTPFDRYTDDDLRLAFDLTGLGWWPASSVPQDVARAEVDRELQRLLPGDRTVQWLSLTLVDDDELEARLKAWTISCFASPASLRADVHADLATMVAVRGVDFVDPATITFRETRTIFAAAVWTQAPHRLCELEPTPDDLLRLFAQLTGGDVSLTERVGYPRLTRAQRRLVVELLEASPRLPDVFRRRGLWLAVARGLHLAEHDAPRVHEVFTRLRAGRHDRTTTPARVEAALRQEQYGTAAGILARESPGTLLRALRRFAALAGSSDDEAHLLTALDTASATAPLRLLLTAAAQVRDNGSTYPRVAFTKRGGVLGVDRSPGHLAVGDELRGRLLGVLDEAIDRRMAEKVPWRGRTVWVDAALDGLLIPDQLRSTAAGLAQVERGSRLPLGDARVLRLFVHWRQGDARSDLDLSVLALDEDHELVDQTSWTQLANGAMTHSGDLIDAPDGAQEFIDIDLGAARARPRWRYVVPAVYRYAGPDFGALPEAHAGWMLRNECSSDIATFDPATVVEAFALTGHAGTAIPIAVDLARSEVLRTDLYVASPWRARVETSAPTVGRLVRALGERHRLKANLGDTTRRCALAQGARLVADRGQADITVGVDEACTFDARQPEGLLAQLL